MSHTERDPHWEGIRFIMIIVGPTYARLWVPAGECTRIDTTGAIEVKRSVPHVSQMMAMA